MDLAEVKKFLTENEDGKALLNEFKKPLVEKRDELLGELSTLKTKFKDVDVDDLKSKAQRVDTLEGELSQLKSKASQGDEKYDQLKQSYEEKLEKERNAANSIKERFKSTRVDSLINEAITKHKGVPELLKPVVSNRLRTEFDDNGDVSITVLDKNGKPYYKDGEEAKVEDIVEELKGHDLYRRAFDGSGASGSGTRTSNANTDTSTDMDSKDFNLTKAMENAKSRA